MTEEDDNRPIKKQRGERRHVNEDNDGFDRISELPDPILSDILSLLPTEDTAGITLLSKRLNSLWTWPLSVLDLDFERFSKCYSKYSSGRPNHDDLKKRFDGFVESCMRGLLLYVTCLKLTCCEFELAFRYRGFCSLKTLIMSRVDLRGEEHSASSVTDLINRCPILEELQLDQCVLPSCFELLAPTTSKLNFFDMDLCSSSGHSGGSDDEKTSIEIVVPSLLKLKFRGLLPEYFHVSAENLIEADICFQDRMYSISHIGVMYNLMADLSDVPTVKLCHSALTTKRNLSKVYQMLQDRIRN